MTRARRRVLLRAGCGAGALLLAAGGGLWVSSAQAPPGPPVAAGPVAAAVPAPALSDTVLAVARREIAEVGDPGTDPARRLADTTGVLHAALAAEPAGQAAASGSPGTVTDAALTTLDAPAGTARLIATVRRGGSEGRFDATLALAGGTWRLASLGAVPTGSPALAPGRGVTAEVGQALTRILSYTPDGTAATRAAADQVLAGTAASQYRQLFGGLTALVRQQGLSVSTRVVRIGVRQQTADRAELLVFLDQTARRGGRAATVVGAQLSVTAQFGGGHWRIIELVSR